MLVISEEELGIGALLVLAVAGCGRLAESPPRASRAFLTAERACLNGNADACTVADAIYYRASRVLVNRAPLTTDSSGHAREALR
jgi:hypothetical protein